ncbi:MAG: hypothetical protein IKD79_06760 [Oscillospiraceae bacterium]|nr:hypothetical protein [Oscillospiraceae bacterium]
MKKKTLSAAAALVLALLLAAFLCLPAFAEGEDGLPEASAAYSEPEEDCGDSACELTEPAYDMDEPAYALDAPEDGEAEDGYDAPEEEYDEAEDDRDEAWDEADTYEDDGGEAENETEEAPAEEQADPTAPADEPVPAAEPTSADEPAPSADEPAGENETLRDPTAPSDEPQTALTGAAAPGNNEVTNPDVIIIPSDANALILMDNGARSPSGAPGDSVTIQLPLAVNKEYLPSSRYVLRNIVVMPDIPTDGGVTSWPFDIGENVNTRYLLDMTYESTADVEFSFRISQYAVRGVYPVNFKVNATVWRYDEVNGTTVTEDVTFRLCVYVTVTDDGNLSGVVTPFGCLQVAGENVSGAYSAASGAPWQEVTLSVPVINVGGTLKNVTVTPVVSGSLDDFPFTVTSANLARSFSNWSRGETKVLEWTFTVSPYATTGNKAIRFKATYFENGAAAECSFSTQMAVTGGYEPTALSVMVQGYELYVDGEAVRGLVAGQEAELRLKLVNNSKGDTARKVLTNLNFSGSSALTLCPGSTDSAYVDSIAPGGTAEVALRVMARADAEAGSAMLGVGVYFESYSGIAGTASQNIMIPVSQKMGLIAGSPAVYGKQILGRELTVSLPLSNMGRGKVLSVRVTAKDGLKQDAPCYVGDILPGGSVTADVAVQAEGAGKRDAALLVEFEDAAGNEYSLEVTVPLEVSEAEPPAERTAPEPTPQPQAGGFGSLTGPQLTAAIVGGAAILLLLILVIVLAARL